MQNKYAIFLNDVSIDREYFYEFEGFLSELIDDASSNIVEREKWTKEITPILRQSFNYFLLWREAMVHDTHNNEKMAAHVLSELISELNSIWSNNNNKTISSIDGKEVCYAK